MKNRSDMLKICQHHFKSWELLELQIWGTIL